MQTPMVSLNTNAAGSHLVQPAVADAGGSLGNCAMTRYGANTLSVPLAPLHAPVPSAA
jgi:hypothetical protein